MGLMQEIKVAQEKNKEERIKFYFETLIIKESKRPSAKQLQSMLKITDEECDSWREKVYNETVMKPKDIRNKIIKEIYKPLLKENGFRTSGNDWWKKIDDGYMYIHIQNSQFNVMSARYRIQIGCVHKDNICEDIKKQWMYHADIDHLTQFDFLTDFGFLSRAEYHSGDMYEIGGLRAYAPREICVEKVMKDFREDFENFILPQILEIKNTIEWASLVEEKKKYIWKDKKVCLLRYYKQSISACCSDSNMPLLVMSQKEYGLTRQEIIEHFDWLEEMTFKSSYPYAEPDKYILKSFDAGTEKVPEILEMTHTKPQVVATDKMVEQLYMHHDVLSKEFIGKNDIDISLMDEEHIIKWFEIIDNEFKRMKSSACKDVETNLVKIAAFLGEQLVSHMDGKWKMYKYSNHLSCCIEEINSYKVTSENILNILLGGYGKNGIEWTENIYMDIWKTRIPEKIVVSKEMIKKLYNSYNELSEKFKNKYNLDTSKFDEEHIKTWFDVINKRIDEIRYCMSEKYLMELLEMAAFIGAQLEIHMGARWCIKKDMTSCELKNIHSKIVKSINPLELLLNQYSKNYGADIYYSSILIDVI